MTSALPRIALASCLLAVSCLSEEEEIRIPVVRIGNQEWMTSNLSVMSFRNGDPIMRVRSHADWSRAAREGKPAWCYYDDNPRNGSKYGVLYNYYAVADSRGLAPAGWRIPDDHDWNELANSLGGEETAGLRMKSIEGWRFPNDGGNESGFSALPGGYRQGNFMSTNFMDLGKLAAWWTFSLNGDSSGPNVRLVNYVSDRLFTETGFDWQGHSVRCVRE